MPGEGIDTVIVKNSILNYYTLPANVENLFFGHKISYLFNEELSGNELDNMIASSGYNGSDDSLSYGYYRCYIDGGAGADIMIATGNDYGIFTVDNPGDRVFGRGEIKSYVDYTVSYGFSLTLIGSSPVNGFGTDGNNGIDASQNPAANILTGGKGNDSYILGAGDRAVELPDEGYDKVKISGSGNWYLSDLANIEEIEMLEAAGNAGIIGDSADNNIKGNKNSNYLDGGAGADIMTGGMGNDIYIIDNPEDVIIEEDGWNDEVKTFISLIMPDSIEIMTLIGSADINAHGNENGGKEICGNEGANLIQGGLCRAYRLYGNGGNDTLNGGELNDVLNGGNGNDILNGSSGNDSYYFNPGFGQDLIITGNYSPEVSNRDCIYLEYGFEPSSVILSKSGDNDILLKISGTNDQILIKNAMDNSGCVLEKIAISGGEVSAVWDSSTIMERLTYINGTAGNDILSGDSSDNIIFGLSGDDSISGLDGSDILYGDAGNDNICGGKDNDLVHGGTGNDSLSGDSGNDTYYFSPDFGNDTIISTGNLASDRDMIFFETGLCAGNMRFIKSGNDLQIKIEGTPDIITAKNHFLNNASTSEAIREIRYYDGTSFDINSITLQTSATYGTNSGNTINGTSAQNVIKGFGGTDKIYGKGGNDLVFGGDGGDTLYGDAGNDIVCGDAGNDKLYGGTGDDTLNGGTGNDTLYGEAGNDTYLFGEGIDKVSDSGGTDVLTFDCTIRRDCLAVFRTSSGDLVWDVDNGTTQIKIIKQATLANTVEKFVTSDGYWLSSSDISTVIQDMTAYASSNGISFESYEDSRDIDLMGILYSAWHAPV